MRSSFLVCLVCVTALLGGLSAGADDQPVDHVILASGERIDCEIVAAGPKRVRVRIGRRTYAFERASLKRVHRAGHAELDPEHLAFVRDVAPRLAHADARLRAAAGAALRSLGEAVRPYLEAVAKDAGSLEVREALRALDLGDGERGAGERMGRGDWSRRFVDRQIAWAQQNVGLKPAQEPGLRQALESFFKGLSAATDRQQAVEALFTALGDVLDKEQIKGMRAAWQNYGNR